MNINVVKRNNSVFSGHQNQIKSLDPLNKSRLFTSPPSLIHNHQNKQQTIHYQIG